MTYHEFINRPRTLRIKIEHKIEDVRLKEAACMTSTAPLNERVQTSRNNTAESSYVRYIDAKNSLSNLMDEYDDAQNEVREFLYQNLPLDEADLLEWRYIDSKTLKQISERRNLSYDYLKNKIRKANKRAEKSYQMLLNVT